MSGDVLNGPEFEDERIDEAKEVPAEVLAEVSEEEPVEEAP